MWTHLYVAEKLRQLDQEDRLARARIAALRQTMSRRPTRMGRLAAIAGRFLRRVGETLEQWPAPASEGQGLDTAFAGKRSRPDRAMRRMG